MHFFFCCFGGREYTLLSFLIALPPKNERSAAEGSVSSDQMKSVKNQELSLGHVSLTKTIPSDHGQRLYSIRTGSSHLPGTFSRVFEMPRWVSRCEK